MNTEMANGIQMTLEMWMPDACPQQTVGRSEHHVRTSLSQGNEQDWTETDQALYAKFLDSWKNKKSKTDLNGLSMKMLRECFLATKDSTICQSSLKWTDLGMISNGRISTQNGSFLKIGSAYTLSDILEDSVPEKYFLSREQTEKIVFAKSENSRTLCARYQKGMTNHEGTTSDVAIKIIGEVNSSQDGQIHDISGISKCHSAGHNNSPKVAIPVLTPDRAEKCQNGRRFKENGDPMFTLTAQDRHGVAIAIDDTYGFGGTRVYEDAFPTLRSERSGPKCGIGIIDPQGRNKKKVSSKDICPTLRSKTHGNVPDVCIDVTGNMSKQSDGIYVEMPDGFVVYAIWYEKEQCYIVNRRLTPKECFRLQGWTDDYFERAAFVNSDSQLYKQAGNGVTVDVVYAIGKKIAECEKESLEEFSKYMNKPEKGEKCEKET